MSEMARRIARQQGHDKSRVCTVSDRIAIAFKVGVDRLTPAMYCGNFQDYGESAGTFLAGANVQMLLRCLSDSAPALLDVVLCKSSK